MSQEMISISRKYAAKKLLKRVHDVLLDELEDIVEQEMNKKKRVWMRNAGGNRKTSVRYGTFVPLPQEPSIEYIAEYRMLLRMTPENFDNLLALISSKIQREDTLLREAIPSRVMLEVTLNFLATGSSYHTLQCCFRVSKAAISNFVPKVCNAITDSLKGFIKIPTTHEEWQTISDGFRDIWDFPGCCGAVDGKHILINTASTECFHYRGTNSVVLIAVVDHKYCITYFEVCKKSSQTDNNVFQNCKLFDRLEKELPNGNFLVGDDTFPLKSYLMKPYVETRKPLTKEEKIFNYRLSRARKTVENVFGILLSRFRALDRRLAVKLDTVNKLVSASCALHNWLTLTSSDTYLFNGAVDVQNKETGETVHGRWRSEIMELRNLGKYDDRITTEMARNMRSQLKEYFSGEGAIPWQRDAMNGKSAQSK